MPVYEVPVTMTISVRALSPAEAMSKALLCATQLEADYEIEALKGWNEEGASEAIEALGHSGSHAEVRVRGDHLPVREVDR
jgi:hypothetical protein